MSAGLLATTPMMSMELEAARAAMKEYRDAVRARHNAEDAAILRGYREMVRGRKLIDVAEVMKLAGLDELGRPRLAICRADSQWCWFEHQAGGRFASEEWVWERATTRFVQLPRGTFGEDPKMRDARGRTAWKVRALLPSIPPRLRPQNALKNYHILWEAEWETVPRDPLLLKHLHGYLYAVLAHWDLTPLEQAVLKGRLTT